MSLYTSFKLSLMSLNVVEDRDIIRITGFKTENLYRAMKQIWSTSKIGNNIFIHSTNTGIIIEKFYALELQYILTKITVEYKSGHTLAAAKRILELLLTNTWLKKTVQPYHNRLNVEALKRFKKTPLDSQYEFFNSYDRSTQLYDLNGYLLAAPPGSGKTLSGLMLAAQKDADTVIVISPKNAIDRVWAATLQNEFVEGPQHFWISNSDEDITGLEPYVICHYEALHKVMEKIKRFHNRRIFIILDECHNFNDIKSQRTQMFIELCEITNPIGVLWASGTPLKAMGSEMIPFLSTADKYFNKDVKDSFKKIFGMGQSHALDILSHRLGLSSYRVDKATVVSGEAIEETIKITFEGSEQYTLEAISKEMEIFIGERVKYYKEREKIDKDFFHECIGLYRKTLKSKHDIDKLDQYEKDVKLISKTDYLPPISELLVQVNSYEKNTIIPNLPYDYRSSFKDVKSIVKYLQLKIRGEALGRILGKRRVDCNVDMVKHITFSDIIEKSEKKTLIFTSFVEVVKEVERVLMKEQYQSLSVYGETNKNLSSIVHNFEKNPDINPLIATYQSLSTAVPLIMANSVVLLNQPFRSIEREQTISRVHRLGQDSQVRVYNYLLDTGDEPNISTRSMDIMKWSQNQIDLMLGIKTNEDFALESKIEELFDLDILDDIDNMEEIADERDGMEYTTDTTSSIFLNW